MERITIEAAQRDKLGKKVRFLRRAGIVPANIYGHGIESVPLQVPADIMKKVLDQAGLTTLISVRVDGGSVRPVFIRKVQRHPMNGKLVHVDFYQVRMDEPIRVAVPLTFTGSSPMAKGVGAILLHNLNLVEMEGLPGNLPRTIEVDISVLTEMDQAIHIKDLRVPEGITVHAGPETVVVKVARERVVEEAKPAPKAAVEGEAAPEAEGAEKAEGEAATQ